jgi:hypothetical protein
MIQLRANNRVHADLWRLIWEAISDFGLSSITIPKVRAHVALSKITDGSVECTWHDWFGNKCADLNAKRGAACHPVEENFKEIMENGRSLITAVARWIGTLGAHLVGLETPDIQPRAGKDGIGHSLELTHIPECKGSEGWRPRVLHREVKNIIPANHDEQIQEEVEVLRAAASPGSSQARHADRSHDLHQVSCFVFCRRCGGYTRGKASRVLRECCKGMSKQTCHKRLRGGRHPLSGEWLGLVTRWRG